MKASDFSIRHPAIVGILLASLLVFALLSYSSLNREMIPSVGLPAANVITAYPGAGAEEIERTVTREIEDQLSTLAGVSSMKSTSKDSYSVVSVDFRDGVDVYEKLPQIRELLNGVRDRLPEGLRGEPEIIVSEASGILPIFSVRVDSDIDRVVLAKRVEEDLVPRLTRIKGVSKVNVRGGAKRRVGVDLDLDRLEARASRPSRPTRPSATRTATSPRAARTGGARASPSRRWAPSRAWRRRRAWPSGRRTARPSTWATSPRWPSSSSPRSTGSSPGAATSWSSTS